MKISKPVSFVLLLAGMFLMAFFGSEIGRSLAPNSSWVGQFMLPGYSLGLIVVSASMFWRLSSEVRDLQAKIQKLENKNS